MVVTPQHKPTSNKLYGFSFMWIKKLPSLIFLWGDFFVIRLVVQRHLFQIFWAEMILLGNIAIWGVSL